MLGGAFFTPWDLDQLDQATLDTLLIFATDLPAYRKVVAEQKAERDRWRQERTK
jgi:hypothetical protein